MLLLWLWVVADRWNWKLYQLSCLHRWSIVYGKSFRSFGGHKMLETTPICVIYSMPSVTQSVLLKQFYNNIMVSPLTKQKNFKSIRFVSYRSSVPFKYSNTWDSKPKYLHGFLAILSFNYWRTPCQVNIPLLYSLLFSLSVRIPRRALNLWLG